MLSFLMGYTSMSNDPIKAIKEFKKQGYTIALSIDSTRPTYAVEVSTQHDVKRFTIPMEQVSYQALHNVIRG